MVQSRVLTLYNDKGFEDITLRFYNMIKLYKFRQIDGIKIIVGPSGTFFNIVSHRPIYWTLLKGHPFRNVIF